MGKAKAVTQSSKPASRLQRHTPLVFEIADVNRQAEHKQSLRKRPSVNSARSFAAIQGWGHLDDGQRRTPVRFDRYIGQQVGLAGRCAETGVLRLPTQLRRFLAGAVSGAFAKTGTAPLEKLRMSLMTSKSEPLQIIADTWRQGGIAAFFDGNGADVLRVMPSKAIELGAFDGLKRMFSTVSLRQSSEGGFPLYFCPPAEGRRLGPTLTMVSGALAGLASTVACFPLETVRTRLAVEPGKYTSIWNCLVVVARSSGPGALYKGISASAIGAVPYSALRFGAFDGLKHIYRKKYGHDIPPMMLVGIGALSGLAASTATFPLEVVRRRMMAGATYPGVTAAVTSIAQQEGWQALYRGLGVSCIKQAPQTGLTLWAYDTCKRLLDLET